MNDHREHTPLSPLSPEDTSLGRLRWIVAAALAGLILVGAAFQLGAAKLRASDRPLPPASTSTR